MKRLNLINLTGCKKFNQEWADDEAFGRDMRKLFKRVLEGNVIPRRWMGFWERTWDTIVFLSGGLRRKWEKEDALMRAKKEARE